MKTTKKILYSPKTEILVQFIKKYLFLFVISKNKNLSKLYKKTKLF